MTTFCRSCGSPVSYPPMPDCPTWWQRLRNLFRLAPRPVVPHACAFSRQHAGPCGGPVRDYPYQGEVLPVCEAHDPTWSAMDDPPF
jgi:hypothetical protein